MINYGLVRYDNRTIQGASLLLHNEPNSELKRRHQFAPLQVHEFQLAPFVCWCGAIVSTICCCSYSQLTRCTTSIFRSVRFSLLLQCKLKFCRLTAATFAVEEFVASLARDARSQPGASSVRARANPSTPAFTNYQTVLRNSNLRLA